ncbi:MAG TPA: NfeD family protein [Acidimicrobiales bacterium]|nr:NfeD family protein [Acidimicrobiales bacterium]
MDDPSTWRWIWLIATGLFAGGEMAVAGSFFLAPFAVGAAVATVLAFVDAPVVAQWAAFVLVSGGSFAAFRPLARRLDASTPNQTVGSTRMTGRTAVVLEEIPTHGVGLVRVDREEWRAESDDGHAIAAGGRVTVVEVRGTRLIVEPTGSLRPRYTPPGLPLDPPPAPPPADPSP